MAISPKSFFNTDTSSILASNNQRDRADARLDSNFQILGSSIIRLSSELGNFSKNIIFGQQQENKILDTYLAEIQSKKKLAEIGIGGVGSSSLSDITPAPVGALQSSNTIPNMSLLGGAAAGGLAATIAGLLSSTGSDPEVPPGSVPTGSLGTEKLVSLAKSAGFNDEDSATMAAIAMAESGGVSSKINDNPKTGDLSYGLWQINMIDKLGPERRKQFGINSNEQLLDPATNINAAKKVKKSQGFGAWSVYKSGTYKQYLPQAQKAVEKLKTKKSVAKTSSNPQSSQSSSISSNPQSSQSSDAQVIKVNNSSKLASGIVPSQNTQELVSSVSISPNSAISKQTSVAARSSTSATAPPGSGHWLSEIARFSMGISNMG
jgi:hypothetical protein